MNYLAFDIETIPNQLLPEECKPVFDPESVKHGNTKDPAKRAAKEQEEREKFDTSIIKTMSLDPAFCSICTFVARRFCDGEGTYIEHQLTEEDGHDDLSIVDGAVKAISEAIRNKIPLVSFNGLSFDLPVIFFRAIAQDIPVDPVIKSKATKKYTNPHHYDLMQILAGWDRQRWHKQDFYVNLLGCGKTNFMDGSMVFETYQRGEYDKIKEYCVGDVQNLSQLFERVSSWVRVEDKCEDEPTHNEDIERLSRSFDEAQAS